MKIIPKEIENFQELENFLKESKLSYREAVLAYYKKLGETLGFTVKENSSVIKYMLNLGRIDLLWVEPKITFLIEFSNLENLLGRLFKIAEFSPSLTVLVLSSTSGCKPKDVKTLIENSRFFYDMKDKFLILDLAEKRIITV